MGSFVRVHVDMADSGFSGLKQGFLHGFGFSHEADDQAIVVRVRPIVEKGAPRSVPESFHNGLDDFGPPALAKIWDAFQKFFSHNA